jgi:hypothetical protein
MSDGTCWPPIWIIAIDDPAQANAHVRVRGQAEATATATSTVRIVWPLG